MKRKLLLQFLTVYLLFFIISISVVFSIAPEKIQDYLLEKKIEQLQATGKKMAEYPEIYSCNFLEPSDTSHARQILLALSEQGQNEVWLVNENGRILMNSQHDYPLAQSEEIPEFNTLISNCPDWITGTFFDMFSRDMLSVIVPVTAHPNSTSFVMIHYALWQLEENANQILSICSFCVMIFLLLSLIFPIGFYLIFYRRLDDTLRISNDYASGNLNSLEPASGNDEFALLKTNLNYMAGEIKQFEENQHKFISNISHDFRSPLTSIKGYAEAILDGTIPKEGQDKYLEIILAETERLTNLTRNILTTNSLKEGGTFLERSVFDINGVLQSSAAAMEIQCRKKDLQILLDLPLYPQNVNADKAKIQQVIYNLLDNAIKFSDPHSTIRISTAEKRKYIFVSIKDNGEGIPADQIPKIWNRFYKSDTSRGKDKKGTGLGLSIVREIIRAHGQNINVVSTKGVGSEFIFTLDKAE